MNLPELKADGYLGPGIYLARFPEVLERFGTGTSARERHGNLLRLIVESARKYPVLSVAKDQRILLWGSFISANPPAPFTKGGGTRQSGLFDYRRPTAPFRQL